MENLFVGTSSFYHFSVLQLHIEPSQSPKHALFRAADPVTVSTTFADVEFRNVTLQSPVLSILPDALRCPQMPSDARMNNLWTMSVAGATAYFGFGALMNKISLRMRGICPQSSCAAKLPGFCLVFGGSHGMATVLRSKTDAVHGVLYMVSCEEKKRLDSTESSYEELEAHVETRTSVALVRWVCVRTILWLARILGYNY